MPYRSFVKVVSLTAYMGKCAADDKEGDPLKCLRLEPSEGSGSIVYRSRTSTSSAFILTAKHICDNRIQDVNDKDASNRIGTIFIIEDQDGGLHNAVFFTELENVDGCILMADEFDDSFKAAPIAQSMPKLGERVFNLSAADGLYEPGVTLTFDGFYSGTMDDQYRTTVFTIPATMGSSGSPVFNEMGEIVSMIWSVRVRDRRVAQDVVIRMQVLESLCFGIDIEYIKRAVRLLDALDDDVGAYERFIINTSTTSVPDLL